MESKVAYICDGLDPKCSGKIGCFKCPGPDFGKDMTCFHTCDPNHAVYGGTKCPEVWAGSRFKVFQCSNDETRYFEEWDEEVVRDLCESGKIRLMPNEPIRDIWISNHETD